MEAEAAKAGLKRYCLRILLKSTVHFDFFLAMGPAAKIDFEGTVNTCEYSKQELDIVMQQ